MEMRKMQLRSLRRAYKKERRRRVTTWKTVTIICLVLSLLFTPVCLATAVFDNGIAAFTGGTFWELKNEDPNAMYFKADLDSKEYRDRIFQQIQAEGTVLLMNNGALPLAAGSRVSALSSSSVDLVCNGNGDGMKTALEASGFTVNPVLWDFYCSGAGEDYRRDEKSWLSPVLGSHQTVAEVPMNVYTEAVKESVAQYGDAVIITISRDVVEDGYLGLTQDEKDMMAFAASMKSSGKVKKVVVLLNTSNPLQMDFLKENSYGVDACLWMGEGDIYAVADVLAGKINPSGSLTDTYCYDISTSPAMHNYAALTNEGTDGETYTVFREGIYVGYKYYETRYEDYVMGSGNPGKYVYGDNVAFPFGFGLSYTTFDYSDLQASYEGETDRFAITVTITNTGSLAGKEIVQVYAQSPYTQYDIDNGIEKASAVLCGFGKTQVLEPGKSETITVYADKGELANYDAYGAGTYILDAGNYYFTVATDAHNAVNNILAAKGYTVENTEGRMDHDGNASMTYMWEQKELDVQTYAISRNGTPVKNQLAGGDLKLAGEKVTYLSRSDWEGTWPEESLKLLLQSQSVPQNSKTVDMPVLGAKNGRHLFELIGLAYDDPLWAQLLDQLTFEDMVSLIGDAYYWRMPVQSIQAPGVRTEDVAEQGVLTATFNTQLAYEAGRVIGNDALEAEVSCLYGPDCSIRRTPYDSSCEDSLLTGYMASAQIRGIQEKGVDVTVKGFAFQGKARGVWLNEQTAREVYLKAFQKPLEEENTTGVMINSVCWGTCRTYAYAPLIKGILQQEWGNRGVYIANVGMETQVDAAEGVLAGVTAYHGALWHTRKLLSGYVQDPAVIAAMREACHRNLYNLANSAAMNGIGKDTYVKDTGLMLVKIMQFVLAGLLLVFIICAAGWNRAWRRLRKTQAYLNYRTMLQAVKAEKKHK